ncbi:MULTISPECIES: hypothetical protein [Desulfovibrio]|uniref:hypothetical protein n=1 Tax=Desulfovibrio TaxID=872 RepID=UPI000BB85C98|nr:MULTISPECIES: hypothetical protein [Desulfovibrio]ATD82225.1 hypothetical protein CNY67_13160 [Desulfovibrio sp. G11]
MKKYLNDEEAKNIFKSIKEEIQTALLKYHSDTNIDELRCEYKKIKLNVQEIHRDLKLQTTTGGVFFQSYLRPAVCAIATSSFSAKTDGSHQKIKESLENAIFEMEHTEQH